MTTPDPKIVREIAAEHIRSGRPDNGITIELMLIGTILDREELAAWEGAVQQAIRTAALSWPDEATGGEQALADDAGHEAVETVRAWVAGARFDEELIELETQTLRAFLAERDALARRVAELEAERKPAERDQLRDEYGIRVFYVNTLIEERAIADTLAGALAELDRFDAQGRSNVVSRKLRVREVGGWRDVEQEAEQREEGARAKFAADLDQLRKTDPGGAQWVEHIVSERTDQQPEDGDRG